MADDRREQDRRAHAARRAMLREVAEERNNRQWYRKAADFVGVYKEKLWDRECTFCGVRLLKGERNGWCCNRGTKVLPLMNPYPLALEAMHIDPALSRVSLRLNRLFTFSVTGVANGIWEHPPNRGTVVLGGRTYHRMLPAAVQNHPIHWLLYDANARADNALQNQVPPHLVEHVANVLEEVNPYIAIFRNWHQNAEPGVDLQILGKSYTSFPQIF